MLGAFLLFMLVGLVLLGMAELLFFGFILFLVLWLFTVSPQILILIIILVILIKVID
ncbi:MAG: hypothetical protein ACOY4Q_05370 [Bacillota bacterium]